MVKNLVFSSLVLLCAIFIRFYDAKEESVMTFSQGDSVNKGSITLEDLANALHYKEKI